MPKKRKQDTLIPIMSCGHSKEDTECLRHQAHAMTANCVKVVKKLNTIEHHAFMAASAAHLLSVIYESESDEDAIWAALALCGLSIVQLLIAEENFKEGANVPNPS